MIAGISNLSEPYLINVSSAAGLSSDESEQRLKAAPVSGAEECQTCKNRKYVDGSNENVSLKSPTKLSAETAAQRVRAHEGEHVSNAYSKAEQENGKVIRASVTIKTAICPECGDSYVAGGVTNTSIKFPGDEEAEEAKLDPYSKTRKILIEDAQKGQNVDVRIGAASQ